MPVRLCYGVSKNYLTVHKHQSTPINEYARSLPVEVAVSAYIKPVNYQN